MSNESKGKKWMIRWMTVFCTAILAMAGFPGSDCAANTLTPAHSDSDNERPHIVFVTGDEEYRSEESMPMLARILKNRYKYRVTVCYAIDKDVIDPNRTDNIEGLEALENADLMVMFTRFRDLPDEQLVRIVSYVESGRPIVGFRTSTHAFRYGEDHENHHMDSEWPHKVFGLPWISHHGGGSSTEVRINENSENHPVLRGVRPFHARSWLYHADYLKEGTNRLLTGRAIEGTGKGGELFDEPHPIAWTRMYESDTGASRVFFTTLGHPHDFFNESMRKLSLNGIFWALGSEDQIPADGLNADLIGEYDPNPAGFGSEFKQNMRPADIHLKID